MDAPRGRSGSEPAGRMTPGGPGLGHEPSRPTVYQVRVKGHLDDRWAIQGEGLTITREKGGDTVLTVPVADQAALHGLLRRLRDVGVPLVSINPGGSGQTEIPSTEENR